MARQSSSDAVAVGQRKVNIIWEITQSAIALSVTICSLTVLVAAGLSPDIKSTEFPPTLGNALFLIVGFYFSRTNHAAIGGVGAKPLGPYQGR